MREYTSPARSGTACRGPLSTKKRAARRYGEPPDSTINSCSGSAIPPVGGSLILRIHEVLAAAHGAGQLGRSVLRSALEGVVLAVRVRRRQLGRRDGLDAVLVERLRETLAHAVQGVALAPHATRVLRGLDLE